MTSPLNGSEAGGDLAVKDNLFSYKIPEVMRDVIDVLVVIKIPD